MYGMRVMEAKHFPQNVMSWVIDGSDASAWSLAHFAQVTHDSQSQKKVKSKVYGVIVHGHWASLHTFNSVLPGGTNVTVEIMHRTLQRLRDEEKPTPRILYVQLDNTCKDKKSKLSCRTCSFLSVVVFLMKSRFFSSKLVTHTVTKIKYFQDRPFIWWIKISSPSPSFAFI